MSDPTHVGPYEVVRALGKGGMGVVYEVRHPAQPGRRMALKLLLTDTPPETLLKRFAREAEVLGRIRHPNIVGVFDFSRDAAGKPYLVFEYIEGRNLRDLCIAAPMDPRQSAEIVRDLADAISVLHGRRILHRDIKPENVMLTPEGRPVLLDFGLARELDAERLTVTGTILGTPSYMAPEQAEGRTDVDARTDVYGLGATLFFLLCGRPPFYGPQPMAVLKQVLLDEAKWPTEAERREQAAERPAEPPRDPRTVVSPTVSVAPSPAAPGHATSTAAGGGDPLDFDSLPGAAAGFGSQPGGQPSGHPGGAPGGFGAHPSGFGSQPGGQPGGFGAHPSGFGSQPGGQLGAQPGGFGAHPSASGGMNFQALPTHAGGIAPTVEVTSPPAADPGELAASTVIHAPVDSRIPRELVAITRVAMQKERDHRFDSAAALRDDLDRYLASGKARAGGQLRRRILVRLGAALGAATLVSVGVVGGLLLTGGGGGARTAATPDPSASPAASSSQPDRPAPSPEESLSPALAQALAKLPPLGHPDLPARLAELAAEQPSSRLLQRLAAARKDLVALRASKAAADFAGAARAWRAAHGDLPRARLGPVALDLGPSASARHAPAVERPGGLVERREQVAVSVAWLRAEGSTLLVSADRGSVRLWSVAGELSSSEPMKLPPAWLLTDSAISDPISGHVYLLGRTLGSTREVPGCLEVGASGVGRAHTTDRVSKTTDRFISGACAADGRIACGTERGELVVWPAGFGPARALALNDKGNDVQAVAFLAERSLAALCGSKKKPGRLLLVADQGAQLAGAAELELADRRDWPTLLLPAGGKLLVGRHSGRLEVYDVESRSRVGELRLGGQCPYLHPVVAGGLLRQEAWGELALVASGQDDIDTVRARDEGGSLIAWSLSDGAALARYRLLDPDDGFHSLAPSPDGRYLAAGTLGGEVLVWDLGERR
ncbi:MAG: protein kinase [Planctomycetota bacterium]